MSDQTNDTLVRFNDVKVHFNTGKKSLFAEPSIVHAVDGISAEIELGTWDVPAGFRQLVEWGDVPDQESFRTWNMGIGLIVAIDAADADAASAAGHPVIGRLVESATGDVELVGDWR